MSLMKFIAVDPRTVPDSFIGHRGRVSYPILKSFLETNLVCAKMERTGMQQTLLGLTSALGAYIRGHGLPIKLFTREGEIYLLRLDLNADGSKKEDYEVTSSDDQPIDRHSVLMNFIEEQGKVTK